MSTDAESLSSILSNAEPPAEKAAEPVKEETKVEAEVKAEEKPVEQPRDEHGKFSKVEDKPEIPRRDVAAIIDERKKRQEVEAKLKELQAQKPKTDFYEDPDKAFSERLIEATAPLQQKLFKMSVRAAEKAHTDFQDAAEAFAKATETDAALVKAMRDADDPGEYIYSVGMQLKELADVDGDFLRYKQKITGEKDATIAEKDKAIAALTAELETLKKSQTELSQVPSSLNKTQSGASPKLEDADPEDIKSIVRFGNSKRG